MEFNKEERQMLCAGLTFLKKNKVKWKYEKGVDIYPDLDVLNTLYLRLKKEKEKKK